VQRGDVLLEGLLLDPARGLGPETGGELEFTAIGRTHGLQVGKLVDQQVLRGLQRGGLAEFHFDGLAIAGDAAVADVFLAQHGAQVAGQRIGLLGQRGLHVHLQHEVHATAQVQPQVHGRGVQRGQPGRRARQQVERHHVGRVARRGVQRLLDRVARLELHVGRFEAGPDRGAFEADAIGGHAGGLQGLGHAVGGGAVDLEGNLGTRYLDCGGFTKKVGKGVDGPYQQSDQNDRVFPDRVTIHGRASLKKKRPLGLRWSPWAIPAPPRCAAPGLPRRGRFPA